MRPASRAARPAAPEGSTTCLLRSRRRSTARLISSSVTVTTSSTSAWTTSRVSGQGDLRAMPSAIVSTLGSRTHVPASSDARIDAAPAASTPMTVMPGRRAFRATAMPATRPPPAYRDHDDLGAGDLAGQLEADRALAGHDDGVVEGGDEGPAGGGGGVEGGGDGVVDRPGHGDDLGAVATGRLHLGQGGRAGHEDGGASAPAGRRRGRRPGRGCRPRPPPRPRSPGRAGRCGCRPLGS